MVLSTTYLCATETAALDSSVHNGVELVCGSCRYAYGEHHGQGALQGHPISYCLKKLLRDTFSDLFVRVTKDRWKRSDGQFRVFVDRSSKTEWNRLASMLIETMALGKARSDGLLG